MINIETCIDKVRILETLFASNQYNGSGKEIFVIKEGNIPVMLSAPHAVNQFREGKTKYADMYTGGIARYLHQVTGCHLICSSRYSGSDPNYDPVGTNRYQEALRDYLKDHKVAVLIDLHGAAEWREYAVEMGTAPAGRPAAGMLVEVDPSLHHYKFIPKLIKKIFKEQFSELLTDKKEICKNKIFDAGDHNTVTRFISQNTDTACIQLEINKIYRDPANAAAFMSLITALNKIIKVLGAIDWSVESLIVSTNKR